MRKSDLIVVDERKTTRPITHPENPRGSDGPQDLSDEELLVVVVVDQVNHRPGANPQDVSLADAEGLAVVLLPDDGQRPSSCEPAMDY